MKAHHQLQQGDVNLETIDRVPHGAKKLDHKVLAWGEVSNHTHQAVADDCALYEKNGVRYLSTPSGTKIQHEEHQTIEIPPGVYHVDIVKEYDHFLEESRSVID